MRQPCGAFEVLDQPCSHLHLTDRNLRIDQCRSHRRRSRTSHHDQQTLGPSYLRRFGATPPKGEFSTHGPDALERLQFIRDAQASGLTLTEIQSILELKDAGHGTCEHTRQLLARHLHDIDTHIARLRQARERIVELQTVAETLDDTDCIDPHRCQVIDAGHRH